jgi:hypothetical protein
MVKAGANGGGSRPAPRPRGSGSGAGVEPRRLLHRVMGFPNPVAFMSFGSQEGPGMTRVAYCSLTHSPRAESVKIGQREARPDES